MVNTNIGFQFNSDSVQNLLPTLLYLFLSPPVSIPETQFTTWNKLISRFVWAGARPRLKLQTLKIGVKIVGLALPKFKENY